MPGETTGITTNGHGLLALDAIQLRTVLENRVVIQQAKGMLAERLRVTLEESSAFMRTAARAQGMNLGQLATEIVQSLKTQADVTPTPPSR
jgi:AmiR/NasT family two-component response regulator